MRIEGADLEDEFFFQILARRLQLKAFFHDKEDDSDTSNKDIFKTLQVRKSKWTPQRDNLPL